ncbi:MAG: GNAT family N-acetyltransferase [Nitrospirae bacterium]|nr:GNAT family N-acetyltransferase [Nitrospirota bacterium]
MLVGIAPLYVEYAEVAGPVRLRQVCFLGDKFVGSDFLDFVALTGREDAVIRLFVDFLLKNLSWHRLYLEDMKEDSPTVAVLKTLSGKCSLSFYVKRKFACPYLAMPESVEEFIKLPESTFKKIIAKKTIPKFFKDFNVEIDYSVSGINHGANYRTNNDTGNNTNNDTGNDASLDAYLERLFALFAERWGDSEWRGFFDDVKRRNFYKKASLELASGNLLRLSAIKVGGTIEAMNYSLLFDDSYYYLLGGCSRKGLKIRAGNVLMFKTLEYLIGKIRVYNFLRGAEAYKYSWGGVDCFTVNVQMGRGGVGKLVSAYESLVHRARAIIKARLRKWKKEKKKNSR